MNNPTLAHSISICRALILIDNGSIKVFGPKHLQVLILNLPIVETVQAELAREAWLDEILPWSYRDCHWPGHLRKSGWIQSLTAAEFKQRLQGTDSFYAIHNLAGKRVPPKRKRMLSLLEA